MADHSQDEDARNLALMRRAAGGEAEAQLLLAVECRRLVTNEEADDIIASVEGITYARMAAAQGLTAGMMILAEHCAHLAKVYAECEAQDCSDSWFGQAIAVLEIATEHLPSSNAADLMQNLNIAADTASPNVMRYAKQFRAIFVPAFGAAAFA